MNTSVNVKLVKTQLQILVKVKSLGLFLELDQFDQKQRSECQPLGVLTFMVAIICELTTMVG